MFAFPPTANALGLIHLQIKDGALALKPPVISVQVTIDRPPGQDGGDATPGNGGPPDTGGQTDDGGSQGGGVTGGNGGSTDTGGNDRPTSNTSPEGSHEGDDSSRNLYQPAAMAKPKLPICAGPGQTNCLCANGSLAGARGCPELSPKPIATSKPGKPKPAKPVIREPATFSDASISCVDGDLYAALKDVYGWKPGLRPCAGTCLPRPTGSLKSLDDLSRLAKQNNISWCPDDCIRISGYLPPEEILSIERKTGRKFCASVTALSCQADRLGSGPAAQVHEKIITIYRDAKATAQPTDQVLLVSVSGYASPLPAHASAVNDLEAMKAAVGKLGYGKDAVHLATDTSAAGLKAFFGKDGPLAKLPAKSNLTVYISALGYTDPASGKSYILPANADPAKLGETGLPLQDLYEALGSVGAQSVTVWLEASFPTSISAMIDPPNLPESQAAVLPDRAIAGLTVLTAADRDQATLVDPDLGTGLFTRYLLEGLSGSADAAPIGNDDRKIDSVELYVYTAHRVRITARKSFGLEQKPQISEAQNALVRAF
ncbi:caspase family protein [Oryzibacter oryziterrae]|uniref:caspase family protein n=1 Tax=Oryzibacter oryziterrae TaxID=2766474 RepID=UPI001F1D202F|nr:hypothetical protein [Oryzibacter oryziterrae]